MYVCICNAVTDHAIRAAAREGGSFNELRRRTGCSDCCGNCEDLAREIFAESSPSATRALDLPLIAAAA